MEQTCVLDGAVAVLVGPAGGSTAGDGHLEVRDLATGQLLWTRPANAFTGVLAGAGRVVAYAGPAGDVEVLALG